MNSEFECNPYQEKREKDYLLGHIPQVQVQEYFKTTSPDDLEIHDFEKIGIEVELTNVKKNLFFLKIAKIIIFCKHLIETCEKISLSRRFDSIS